MPPEGASENSNTTRDGTLLTAVVDAVHMN